MRLKRLLRIGIAVVVAAWLSGCDPFAEPDSMLEEYVERVGRVLDTQPALREVPTAPGLPRRRERLRELPDIKVGMLDFLGLYGCELQQVVGERNSILGRVMHPSRSLDYEVRFMRAARECIEQLERKSLVERLQEVSEIKRESMPDAIWNAIWGSREIETLFTRSRGTLAVDYDRDLIAGMDHDMQRLLSAIERLQNDDTDVDVQALDPVYQRWTRQPVVGQGVRSALLIAARLNDAASVIERRLERRPVCHDGKPTREAEIMRNMFQSVFVEHVQPYVARVQRVRTALLPRVETLAQIGDVSDNPLLHQYLDQVLRDGPDSVWRRFDDAVIRHTEAWQRLLEQCGMSPRLPYARSGSVQVGQIAPVPG